jgi:hypothetical protein
VSHQVFTPPIAAKQDPASRGHRLWRFYRADVGVTVLKLADGSFVQRQYVDQTEADGALSVYLGGHAYTVSAAEVSALTAAGYGAYITTVADEPTNSTLHSPDYGPLPTDSPNPPPTYP